MHKILLVNKSARVLAEFASALTRAGYEVRRASTFAEASRSLEVSPPDLLVTELRLAAFNGLHLVLHGRAFNQRLAAILVDDSFDPLLDADATAYGATYVVKPMSATQLLDLVGETLSPKPVPRRWPRKPLTSPVPVSIGNHRATMVDVSYSGFGFEMSQWVGELPESFAVNVPALACPVVATLIWMSRAKTTQVFSYGAALSDADVDHLVEWRAWVDHVDMT